MPGEFQTLLKNQLLDFLLRGVDPTYPANLHLALFDEAGVEIAGNGYARVAIARAGASWIAAAAGATENAGVINFPAPTGAGWGTVGQAGIMDAAAAGNALIKGPLRGPTRYFRATAADDTFLSTAHGLANDTAVRVEALPGLALPTGIAAGTTYYVVNSAANTCQLAAAPGGAAIALTADGAGIIYAYKAKTINAGDPVSFPAGELDVLFSS